MTEPVRSPSYCVLFVAPDDGRVSEAEQVVRSVAPSIRRVPPDRLIDVVRGDPTVSIAILAMPSAEALDASLYALEPTLPVLWIAAEGAVEQPHFAGRTLQPPLQPQQLRALLERLSGLDVYSQGIIELLCTSVETTLRQAFETDATVTQVFLRNNRRPLGTVAALLRIAGPDINATVGVAGAPEPFRAMRQRLLPELGRGMPQIHDLAAEIANHVAQPIKAALEQAGFQITRDPPVTSLNRNLREELAERSVVLRTECTGGPVFVQLHLLSSRPVRLARDSGTVVVPGEVRFL
jgi:CheY-specific phosphatase CheX